MGKSGATSDAVPFAQHGEWGVNPEAFPEPEFFSGAREAKWRVVGDKPIVNARAFDQFVAACFHRAIELLAFHVVFEQHQFGAMPSDVETPQDVEFHAFHINREKINRRISCVCEQFVEGHDLHGDGINFCGAQIANAH